MILKTKKRWHEWDLAVVVRGAVHSIIHPLGVLYDISHRITNEITILTVMKFNAPEKGNKYCERARTMGVLNVNKMTQGEYREALVQAV